MITDQKGADRIFRILLEAAGHLHESIGLVEETCPEEDGAAYRRAATQILSDLFAKLLGPISAANPIQSPETAKPMSRHPMVMNIDAAKRVSEIMFEVSNRLNESLEIARTVADAEAFKIYARGVGVVLTDIMYEVLNPVYAKHPSIEPKGWKEGG